MYTLIARGSRFGRFTPQQPFTAQDQIEPGKAPTATGLASPVSVPRAKFLYDPSSDDLLWTHEFNLGLPFAGV